MQHFPNSRRLDFIGNVVSPIKRLMQVTAEFAAHFTPIDALGLRARVHCYYTARFF